MESKNSSYQQQREIMPISYPLTIFYDGACGVCSTEISYYRSIADQRVRFVDIAAVDFDAGQFGKTIDEFQDRLHANDAEGRYFTGVEAFRQLWEALPSPFYPLLSTFVGLPGINLAARTGYAFFARYRHLLSSKHTDSCPITKNP
jgi:predicted DCC family thiol-disulfide oxidoreductase YuxK